MRTFYTEHGKIVFESDRILIEDNAKKEKFSQIFLSLTGLIVGLTQIYQSLKGDGILWLGIGLCLIYSLIFILYLFRSISNEIPFSEIKSIKVRNILGNDFLHIKLKNRQSRHVNGAFTREKLENFLAEEFQK